MNEDTKYNEWYDSKNYEVVQDSVTYQPLMKFPDGRTMPLIRSLEDEQ